MRPLLREDDVLEIAAAGPDMKVIPLHEEISRWIVQAMAPTFERLTVYAKQLEKIQSEGNFFTRPIMQKISLMKRIKQFNADFRSRLQNCLKTENIRNKKEGRAFNVHEVKKCTNPIFMLIDDEISMKT